MFRSQCNGCNSNLKQLEHLIDKLWKPSSRPEMQTELQGGQSCLKQGLPSSGPFIPIRSPSLVSLIARALFCPHENAQDQDQVQKNGHEEGYLSQNIILRGFLPWSRSNKELPERFHKRLQTKAHKHHCRENAHDLTQCHGLQQSSDHLQACLLELDISCEVQKHSQKPQASAQNYEEDGQMERL